MKRVLITGASSGIGMHLAQSYLKAGCEVIACGRSHEKLSGALPTGNNNLQLCVFDIDNREDTIAQLQPIASLDLVILNAGTCEYIDDPQSFDSALLERVMQTNVIGTGYCLEATLKNIKPGGQLAIVSSTVTLLPMPRAEAYGASKAALDYLTRTLSIHLTPKGIDVSLVSPGFVDTPLTQKNTFSMPGMVTSEEACDYITQGLSKRKREIMFPKRFAFTLKLFTLLPKRVWRYLAIKMIKDES